MRLAPLFAALGLATALSTTASAAQASEGEGLVYVLATALFDVVALPADLVFAITHAEVDHDYAQMELILGGVQSIAGVIGSTYCMTQPRCRGSAALPALVAVTVDTTAIGAHGFASLLSSSKDPLKMGATRRRSPLALTPLLGDGRSTPAGIGLGVSF